MSGNMRFLLELLAAKRLSFAGLLTQVFAITEAGTGYEAMAANAQPFLGLGLRWDAGQETGPQPHP